MLTSKYTTLIPSNMTQAYYNQDVPLYIYYMFQPFLRPLASMSIRKSYTGSYNKTKSNGPLVYSGIILTSNSKLNGSNPIVLITK